MKQISLIIIVLCFCSCVEEDVPVNRQHLIVKNFTTHTIDTIHISSDYNNQLANFQNILHDSISDTIKIEGLHSKLYWKISMCDTVINQVWEIPISGNQLDPIDPKNYFLAPTGKYIFGINQFDSLTKSISVFLYDYKKMILN